MLTYTRFRKPSLAYVTVHDICGIFHFPDFVPLQTSKVTKPFWHFQKKGGNAVTELGN